MSLSLGFAIYFICWWVVLFAILPLRLGPESPEHEHDPFADAVGAPHAPRIGTKFLITTVVSAFIFAIIYAILAFRLITLDSLPF